MEVLRADQGTLELRLGASILRPAHTRGLLAAVLGLPLILILFLTWLMESKTEQGSDAPGIWETMWTNFTRSPEDQAMLWMIAVLLPVGIAFLAAQRLAYLRVTPAGLEGYIPRWIQFGLLRQTTGRWNVRWDEVRSVRLVLRSEIRNAAQRLGFCRLVIETEKTEVRVAAFSWFDGAGHDHRLGLGEFFTFWNLDPARRLQSAPLIRAIEARGLEIENGTAGTEPAPPSGFDLAQHKGMLAQIGLLFVAGLYALGDGLFVRAYLPLGSLPIVPFAVTGAVAAFAVSKLGRGAPAVERLAVGVLAVAACVAAAYPAMLRFNAATAEAEIVGYVSLGGGRFEAPYVRLPQIDLSGENVAEYWAQYPPGAEHEFTLLRGSAGFYQLEMTPLHERTRQFYAER